jgi:RNA polymerase sigma-70 factor (ECF subfamily)
VSNQDELAILTPRLRRYARALVAAHPAPNDMADELVRTAIQRMFSAGMPSHGGDLDLRAYTILTELHREALHHVKLGTRAALQKGQGCTADMPLSNMTPALAVPRDKLSYALGSLPLEEKEALLLVVLEGFSYAKAARIMKISRAVLVARLARARETLGAALDATMTLRSGKTHAPYLRVVK